MYIITENDGPVLPVLPSGILSKYTSTATEVGVASQSQQTAGWLD